MTNLGLLIWLLLAAAYGVSVLLLIRQERYGLPCRAARTGSNVPVLRHRGLLVRRPLAGTRRLTPERRSQSASLLSGGGTVGIVNQNVHP